MRFDYQEFRVSGVGNTCLGATLSLALALGDDTHFAGYRVSEVADEDDRSWGVTNRIKHPALMLITHIYADDKVTTVLPAPVKVSGILEIAWEWLQHVQYPPQPDHDGSNGKGWRVRYSPSFDERNAILVEPAWAIYGK